MGSDLHLSTIFLRLGIALGLGLLVGLQRERVASRVAGFRTFPLVTVLGSVSALLAAELGGWLLAAVFLGLAGLILTANLMLSHIDEPDPGQTTEVALLLMFAVGAYLIVGEPQVAVAVAGTTAVLLYLKGPLHGLADRIGDRDFRAIIQFVLISLVILPVLPDRIYGPFEVLNPREIWWMVVLIVGISLGGYVAFKLLGRRGGILLAGLLGGLVSSTATTVSYARRSRERSSVRPAVLVILLASAVVFVRVLVEMAVVARQHFWAMAGPVVALLAVAGGLAALLWWGLDPSGGSRVEGEMERAPEPDNPTELGSALLFGVLYGLMLLAVAAAKEYWSEGGLMVVSVLSGLTDMDAITLSTSRLVQDGRLEATTGWRLIVVASLSNLVFKGAVVAVLGRRALAWWVAVAFAVLLAAGGLILWWWPV